MRAWTRVLLAAIALAWISIQTAGKPITGALEPAPQPYYSPAPPASETQPDPPAEDPSRDVCIRLSQDPSSRAGENLRILDPGEPADTGITGIGKGPVSTPSRAGRRPAADPASPRAPPF